MIENPDTAPNPGSAGGLKGTTIASGKPRVAAATLPTIVEACWSFPGRSSQGFSRTIRKRAVRRSGAGDQVVAGDHLHVRNARNRARNLLYLARDRDRALLRGGLGEDHLREHRALVLVRDEAGRRDALHAAGREDHRTQDREHDQRAARAVSRDPTVVIDWCDRRCG